MLRRSAALEATPSILEHNRPANEPSGKLRAFMGRMGLLKASADYAVSPTDTEPKPESTTLIEYSHTSLKKYLVEAGIDPDNTHMAIPVAMLPKLAVPEELTIVPVSFDDKNAAIDYHAVAAQNLNPDHCPVPYTDPRVDESNRSYYVGYITLPDQEPTAAVTLETIDYSSKGKIALIDNVSTLESFRGHNYAGILISNALCDSKYAIALLSSLPEARTFYERLGFLPVE